MKIAHTVRAIAFGSFASLTMVFVLVVVDKVGEAAGANLDFIATAAAQQDKKRKTRKLPGISESTMKKLSVVTELTSPDTEKNPDAQPNFPKALRELQKMERSCKDKCNKYELSQIYRFYAFVHYSMDDYPKSIESYKRVAAQSPEIPIAVELEALNSLAQLTYSLDRYDEALKYLSGWMALSTIVGADKFFLRGTIYYAKNDKKRSLADVNKAISMTEANDRVAKEQWYGLQRALYLEKEDYRTAKGILEKLVRHYPKTQYWTQFANINGLLEREKDQLHALDAVYVMGGLKKRQDIVNTAYLYLGEDVPYKAAKILEKGMKEKLVERSVKYLRVLATAWRAAREHDKAISTLKEAAAVAVREDAAKKNDKKYRPEEGNIYAELVALYANNDNAKSAVEAGKKAVRVGNLKRACEVHTNMGIAYVDLRQYKSAIRSFEKAREDKQCRAIVTNWIRYAQNEQKQKEELSKSI